MTRPSLFPETRNDTAALSGGHLTESRRVNILWAKGGGGRRKEENLGKQTKVLGKPRIFYQEVRLK
jgi:hypothetical protein